MVKSYWSGPCGRSEPCTWRSTPSRPTGATPATSSPLRGPVEDLKVPRVREGEFHPKILPHRRRTSLELSEAILVLYAAGVNTRAISRFFEGIHGAFYSPRSISRLTQVVEEEIQSWRERPLAEEYYAVFLDGTFLAVRRGKTAKKPVYIALGGIKPNERREILGVWLFGAEGESARNWGRSLRISDAGACGGSGSS